MPALRNARHEAFCRNWAQGLPVVDAYYVAGYAKDSSAAYSLSKKPEIIQRYNEIKDGMLRATTDLNKYRVAALVEKSHQIIEKAIENKDMKAAVDMMKVLLTCGGYMDSPTLFHEHLFKEPLGQKHEDAEQDRRQGEAVGAGMVKAVAQLERMINAKTIDGKVVKD